jgi:hypothetical protein
MNKRLVGGTVALGGLVTLVASLASLSGGSKVDRGQKVPLDIAWPTTNQDEWPNFIGGPEREAMIKFPVMNGSAHAIAYVDGGDIFCEGDNYFAYSKDIYRLMKRKDDARFWWPLSDNVQVIGVIAYKGINDSDYRFRVEVNTISDGIYEEEFDIVSNNSSDWGDFLGYVNLRLGR